MEECQVKAYRIFICKIFACDARLMDENSWRLVILRQMDALKTAVFSLHNYRCTYVVGARLGEYGEVMTFRQIAQHLAVSNTRVQQLFYEVVRQARRKVELGPLAEELLAHGCDTDWVTNLVKTQEVQRQLIECVPVKVSERFLFDHAADCAENRPCASCRARMLLRGCGIEEAVLSLYEQWNQPNILDIPIRYVWPEWSARTHNCLYNELIVTARQLAGKSEAELMRIPNFGRRSLNEIKEGLGKYGLVLSD